MGKIFNHLKANAIIYLFAISVLIFSVVAINGLDADGLQYSFPAEGTDLTTIMWSEVPLDEHGQEFVMEYDAWDIDRIGIGLFHDSENSDGKLELHITDSSGNDQGLVYRIEDFKVDSQGNTWLAVDKHVQAGMIKVTLSTIDADDVMPETIARPVAGLSHQPSNGLWMRLPAPQHRADGS